MCGDVGDPNFDYTWVEGIEACNVFESSSSDDVQSHIMARQEKTRSQQITTRAPKTIPKPKLVELNTESRSDGVFDVDAVSCKEFDELSESRIFAGVSLIALQMWV